MSLVNFNAGPSALPQPVIHTIKEELLDWNQTGISILATGHRTAQFGALGEKLEASVRRILQVPDEFAVLFLPGGAQIQFAMATMNLVRGFKHANYVETGHWSQLAMKEGQKYIDVHVAASSKKQNYIRIPEINTWNIKQDGAFLHYCDNETINGVEFPFTPEIDDMVLVSDMSSNIFSRAIDFKRMGCIYACAQKNMGIAGMSLVIVRRDLLDRALPQTPAVFHYATQEKNHSLACTPTTFAWYVASLVLDWIEQEGGLKQMTANSVQKSKILYDCIDASAFYNNPVDSKYRSRMNVPFFLKTPELEAQFLEAAKQQGLLCLKGHRLVGGIRASIYNAINIEDVQRLQAFMVDFASGLFS